MSQSKKGLMGCLHNMTFPIFSQSSGVNRESNMSAHI